MPDRKREFFAALALFAVALAVAAAVALPGYSQSPASSADAERRPAQEFTRERVVAEAAAAERTAAPLPNIATATPAAISAVSSELVAARQNAALSSMLGWFFGGRQQRGWSLYQPLIASTLAVEARADSKEFAQAVSRWQNSLGLQPSGVLDRDSWMKLVETWQSRRLKESASPSPAQLVTVSPAEFYDPARPAELRQVERETYAAYRRMLAAAAADNSLGLRLDARGELSEAEKFFKIISAFRSREYQERLRQQQPGAGRAALAVNSPHFTGRALDLYVGGYDPVSTKDDNRALQTQTRAYRWLVQNAGKFGFRPYYFEPWHWEYVGQ